MPIHAPRARLRTAALRRRPSIRSLGVPRLVILPLVDLMVVLVMFYLPSFSASGEVICLCRRPELPTAEHTSLYERAPVVTIMDGRVTLDAGGAGRHVDPETLTADLRVIARHWSLIHPGAPAPRTWILEAARDTDFRLVREVFSACARAGFTDGQLLVTRYVDPFSPHS